MCCTSVAGIPHTHLLTFRRFPFGLDAAVVAGDDGDDSDDCVMVEDDDDDELVDRYFILITACIQSEKVAPFSIYREKVSI